MTALLFLRVIPSTLDNATLIKFQKCALRNFSSKRGFKGSVRDVSTERWAGALRHHTHRSGRLNLKLYLQDPVYWCGGKAESSNNSLLFTPHRIQVQIGEPQLRVQVSLSPGDSVGSLCTSVSAPCGHSALPERFELTRPPGGGARAEPPWLPASLLRLAPGALSRGGGWNRRSTRAPSSAETGTGRRRSGREANVRPLPAAADLPVLWEAAPSSPPGLSLPVGWSCPESASGLNGPGKSWPSRQSLTRGLCPYPSSSSKSPIPPSLAALPAWRLKFGEVPFPSRFPTSQVTGAGGGCGSAGFTELPAELGERLVPGCLIGTLGKAWDIHCAASLCPSWLLCYFLNFQKISPRWKWRKISLLFKSTY